ncbi:MAG: TIGR03757 family integrating conjugative element protein [Betaproteobacteria bacterium]|nr:TIGR03757 family integrating conjugative element protein [Betaproteobacteria bacterium]
MTLVGSVRVVALDAPKQIEAVLSEGLPPDASKAAVIIRQRLAQNPAIHQQLAVAHQGVLDAFSLGVTKIPAVVVDRRFVVYGEHDVEAALAKIATYRNGVQLE